ncbi:hypothetical protein SO802_003521 [Lithocarpus litseifolius]|uniref:Reverse transcriptase domain-containing protein n=1 Tax=Lithocarpus litseifolius TaxID=425828 RepID=A0AAW2E0W8_9ROSI
MNIIVWNSRGILKPNFQNHVRELTRVHDPALFVVMETHLGGERAKEITDRLSYEGAIHTNTIGRAGGLWVLWNSDKAELFQLTSIEQEIHVSVKVYNSKFTWIFSTVYASPRLAERSILWNNLCSVVDSHNLPWVIAGDFNEPLCDNNKFGGRSISVNRSLLFKECLDRCNMIDLGFSGRRYTWSNRRVFSNAWRNSAPLPEAIERFSKNANHCNKTYFGNIFAKKKKLMARLNGIQRSIAMRPSASLIELEKKLQSDLELVLAQEEELWALKSRLNWMVFGDRNTSFYHMSAIVRRKKKNKIQAIKNSVGEWLLDEREVMKHIRKSFMELYSTSHRQASWVFLSQTRWQLGLTKEEKSSLDGDVTDEEIKAALWSLKAYKAPGPDGLHAGFFRRYWLVVGDLVKAEINKVFENRKVPGYLNKTYVALIPKIQGPKTIRNFRPFSLRNTELIHTISRKRGSVGNMAIKIDLKKAYDKLEWSFIRDTLHRANLLGRLIDIIMSCVTSVSTSILFNGGSLEESSPSRGIRQGDSLSPYLFILCIDYLGQLIAEKCETKCWTPVKASRGGLAFSHLFFVDDIVLFAKADQINCFTIQDVLDQFCDITGQMVSESKSRVFFSLNVDRDKRESFSDILGIQSTPNLGRYLGIPIKAKDHPIKILTLSGLKANMLSLARRSVLVQASSSTIPNYVMHCTHLPSKILDGIGRVNRNFLWGTSEQAKKVHWVGWDKITRPKEEGGLGLQSARGRNIALLSKLNWRFHMESESL